VPAYYPFLGAGQAGGDADDQVHVLDAGDAFHRGDLGEAHAAAVVGEDLADVGGELADGDLSAEAVAEGHEVLALDVLAGGAGAGAEVADDDLLEGVLHHDAAEGPEGHGVDGVAFAGGVPGEGGGHRLEFGDAGGLVVEGDQDAGAGLEVGEGFEGADRERRGDLLGPEALREEDRQHDRQAHQQEDPAAVEVDQLVDPGGLVVGLRAHRSDPR
jgi:hypothetical protein